MILGFDPVDVMVFLMAGLIFVIGAMFIIMFRMVSLLANQISLLEGIRDENRNSNGHLQAISGPLADVHAAITGPVARLGSAR